MEGFDQPNLEGDVAGNQTTGNQTQLILNQEIARVEGGYRQGLAFEVERHDLKPCRDSW